MFHPSPIIEQVISELDIDQIDPRYITMAKIVDMHGAESLLEGAELREFLTGPTVRKLRSVKVHIDTRSLKLAMYIGVMEMLKEYEERIAQEY